MSLKLELPHDLETELAQRSAQLGLPLSEYAVRLLSMWGTIDSADSAMPASLPPGAELVAYWQREGLIGTHSNAVDSPDHARAIACRG
jgi:hypothetical protein